MSRFDLKCIDRDAAGKCRRWSGRRTPTAAVPQPKARGKVRPKVARDADGCPIAAGPGTQLCRYFHRMGFTASESCPCKALAGKMNTEGVEWCAANVDAYILPILKASIEARQLPWVESIARQFVEAAIREARGEKPTLTQSLTMGAARVASAITPDRIKNPPAKPLPVSVVIPCHNYGRFLAEAIESAIEAKAAEIVVVDDASDDETAEVAARYQQRGVRYIRVDARSVHAARRAGFEATASKYVCFLDADDRLSPEYLATAVEMLEDPENYKVGVVYSDLHQFGLRANVDRFPDEVTLDEIERQNSVHAGAVARRRALQIARPFDLQPHNNSHADWFLWRQVMRHGWRAVRSPAVYHYRRHEDSMMATMNRRNGRTFYDQAAYALETISLLILLSDRQWAWQQLAAWLDRQTWPKGQVRLTIGDTSQSEELAATIRSWIAGSGYTDVRHLQFSVSENPGLADAPRRDHATEVTDAVSRGWSRLTRDLSTAWALCLEDDILPPDDAIVRMLHAVTPAVDAVCAPYLSRHSAIPHWLVFRERGGGGGLRDFLQGEEPKGVSQVAGSGFGCLLCRTEFLRNHPFGPHGSNPWYDPSFFQTQDLHVVCDWSLKCRHYSGPDSWV